MLTLENISKTFRSRRSGNVQALESVSLQVEEGEFFTLLGPSGCGKTTLLRMIAGLETPDAGEIAIGDRMVFSKGRNIDLSAAQRDLGFVFQSFAIWPHMKVGENVEFPLRALKGQRRLSSQQIEERVHDVLAFVDLDRLASRSAADLSGGQRQRLALARAIAAKPRLILLDEPLSNLDAKLRERLRRELKEFQRRLGTTFVYVTHDQHEALSLSHRIAVMDGGNIVQIGTPEQVYSKPKDLFVAGFVGKGSILSGALAEKVVQSSFREAKVMLRPEAVRAIADETHAKGTTLRGVFRGEEFFGERRELQIECEGQIITVFARHAREFQHGETVLLEIDPEKIIHLK